MDFGMKNRMLIKRFFRSLLIILYHCVDWILNLCQKKKSLDTINNRIKIFDFYLLISSQVFGNKFN